MIRTIILVSLIAGGALCGQSAESASAPAPKPAAATDAPGAAADAPAGQPSVDTQPRPPRYRRRRYILAGKPGVVTDAPAPKSPAVTGPPAGKVAAVKEPQAAMPAVVRATPSAKPPGVAGHSHYRPERFSRRAGLYYDFVWGVDSLSVKWTESGEVIRFSYRVLDAERAKPLNDKRAEPSLIDPQAGVKLVVPSLEKVGQLRQSSTPIAGKSYWMAFSNKGRPVKRGDHVDVVIGKFRAEGLVVD